jgi:Xaa-Pro aminopeptidase
LFDRRETLLERRSDTTVSSRSDKRLESTFQAVQEKGCDGFLVTNLLNVRYLSGFTGSAGFVMLHKNGSFFVSDFRYTTQSAQEVKDCEILIESEREFQVIVSDLASRAGIKKMGFEAGHLNFARYQKLKNGGFDLVPLEGVVETKRKIKDEGEIQLLSKACEIGDEVFRSILDMVKPGAVENDIAAEIEYQSRKRGGENFEGIRFAPIVASGPNSALPHARAGERKMEHGDFVVFDFGVRYEGYISDMTRTVVVGEATPKHREIYDIVLEAQLSALEQIRPGMKSSEADALARGVIEKKGYGKEFGHGLGHGIGLDVHEEPALTKRSDKLLESGMVVTVEPGIYIPEWGGVRIEDDVVLKDGGCEILSGSTKELLEV